MTVQELAAALIASWEGLRLTAYQDGGGVWTIGLGHTAGVRAGDTCTPDEAAQWFLVDAAPLFGLVSSKPLVAAAAYVSFGYNCGRHSLTLVLAGMSSLSHYVHDRHGNVEPGLVHRRGAEQALIDASLAVDPGPKIS